MAQIWQLQDAKNKFSQLVKNAVNQGPQIVTKHGRESVVVLAIEDYRKLTQKKGKLSQFFRESPLVDVEINIERDNDPGRTIEL